MPPTLPQNQRLRLRELGEHDADFVLAQLNDPDFLAHIGDRGVRDLQQARDYLATGPMASYARHGFGLWGVELKASGELAGMCGLIQRDALPAPDLGYALLSAFRGLGLAREAARLSLDFGFEALAMPRILAIVTETNAASRRLLESLDFYLDGPRALGGETLLVYAIENPSRLRPASGSGS